MDGDDILKVMFIGFIVGVIIWVLTMMTLDTIKTWEYKEVQIKYYYSMKDK